MPGAITEIPPGELAAYEVDHIQGVAFAALSAANALPKESKWGDYFAELAHSLEEDIERIQLVPGPRSMPEQFAIPAEHRARFNVEAQQVRRLFEDAEMSASAEDRGHAKQLCKYVESNPCGDLLVEPNSAVEEAIDACLEHTTRSIHGAGEQKASRESRTALRELTAELDVWMSLADRLEAEVGGDR